MTIQIIYLRNLAQIERQSSKLLIGQQVFYPVLFAF